MADQGVSYLLGVMRNAFPDGVERSYYADMISTMPNDEKDRHVLAAAIAARADVLVTANVKDFLVPEKFCNTDIQHPDDFYATSWSLPLKSFLIPSSTLPRIDVSQ